MIIVTLSWVPEEHKPEPHFNRPFQRQQKKRLKPRILFGVRAEKLSGCEKVPIGTNVQEKSRERPNLPLKSRSSQM